MSELINVVEGDWIVAEGQFGYRLSRAEKVTAKMVKAKVEGRYAHSINRDKIVFAGPETPAKLLAERLTSSRAQMHSESSDAHRRMMKRDREFIDKARGVA